MRRRDREHTILEVLAEIGDPMTGAELVKADRGLKRGSVYVDLHRLRDAGMVDSHRTDETPPRYVFSLTEAGRKALDA